MSALSAYLAKNYLNASNSSDLSERPKKRRKKDKATAEQSLVIADDDDDLLLSSNANARGRGGRGDEEDDVPQLYEGHMRSAEFRKKKTSGWKSVATEAAVEDGGHTTTGATEGDDEAERIIAEAKAADDIRRKEMEDEDAPAVVEGQTEDTTSAPKMASGFQAGLQTAADTARLVERQEREKRIEEKRSRKAKKDDKEEETIYRDATGRRIDVSLKRQEARQAEVEKERQRQREREEAMGDVQRRMREERREELDEAKFLTVARGADDEDMNDRMKDVERWDDPMAAYMARKRAEDREGDSGGGGGGGGSEAIPQNSKKGSGGSNKVYQGAAPPNRYGILPGWRWDGVDRGNGFEKEWFQARSKTKRNEDLSWNWQMDE